MQEKTVAIRIHYWESGMEDDVVLVTMPEDISPIDVVDEVELNIESIMEDRDVDMLDAVEDALNLTSYPWQWMNTAGTINVGNL